ncbi:MAG: hypothetical protein OXJ52_07145 [Oligoflexia bacterium]|nr:hypothetical protein [Oligoflexia bacterium]
MFIRFFILLLFGCLISSCDGVGASSNSGDISKGESRAQSDEGTQTIESSKSISEDDALKTYTVEVWVWLNKDKRLKKSSISKHLEGVFTKITKVCSFPPCINSLFGPDFVFAVPEPTTKYLNQNHDIIAQLERQVLKRYRSRHLLDLYMKIKTKYRTVKIWYGFYEQPKIVLPVKIYGCNDGIYIIDKILICPKGGSKRTDWEVWNLETLRRTDVSQYI